jgi:adenosylhomocysteine nucleosidase
VNAAYRLTKRLAGWRLSSGDAPSMVLNLGSAGSATFKTGTIVNCTRYIERDLDATALGLPPYVTPFDDLPAILENGLRFERFQEGICGTGDAFVTGTAPAGWNVVDMEAYALAKVCLLEKVPFGCLKYITDGADLAAGKDWKDDVTNAARALYEALASL